MPSLARAEKRGAIARPLKTLVPLIQMELEAADSAGLENYRRAGALLLEARDSGQVGPDKWPKWLKANFRLSKETARRYMRFAEEAEANARLVHEPTLSGALGYRQSDSARRINQFQPIREFTANVNADRIGQERQARDDETKLHRELAIELIDIGYKALATRLHPDRGGSKDAMRRLNRVRDELKGVAESRRFE